MALNYAYAVPQHKCRPMRKTARQLLQEVREEIANLAAEYKRLEDQQDKIEERQEELNDLAQALESVLQGDPVEQPSLSGIPPVTQRKKGSPLGEFLRETLSDGKSKTTEEISAIAEKTIPSEVKGKSVRRMVNFALLALQRHGAVIRGANGAWQLKQRQ